MECLNEQQCNSCTRENRIHTTVELIYLIYNPPMKINFQRRSNSSVTVTLGQCANLKYMCTNNLFEPVSFVQPFNIFVQYIICNMPAILRKIVQNDQYTISFDLHRQPTVSKKSRLNWTQLASSKIIVMPKPI